MASTKVDMLATMSAGMSRASPPGRMNEVIMRAPLSRSKKSRIFSRSRQQYRNGELAPRSSAIEPINIRCEATRVISASSTRRTVARSGIPQPSNLSTERGASLTSPVTAILLHTALRWGSAFKGVPSGVTASLVAIRSPGHGEIDRLCAERLGAAQREAPPFVGQHDAPQVRVALEGETEQIEQLALVPVGAGHDGGDAGRRAVRSRLEPHPRVLLERVEQVHKLEAVLAREQIDCGQI